jgi:hypothetical protein
METLLASRISGLEQPSITLLAMQLQSFSFYNDQFTLFDKQYLSPLAPEALSRYTYTLTDSLFEGGDTLYIIRFEPEKGSSFPGLKGELHISSNGYAIRDVTASPAENDGAVSVSITQRYVQVDSTHWFPVQLNTEWYNNFFTVIGDRVEVGGPHPGDTAVRRTKLVCRTYLSDINLDTTFRRRDFSDTELEIVPGISNRDSAFWKRYRVTPLSEKELLTYHRIDSLGLELKLDRKIRAMATAFRGKREVGPVDIDVARLASYNYYEALRLGLGLHTRIHRLRIPR